MNVVDKDLGWKRIKRKVTFLDGKEVRAGVLPSAGNEKNGKSIAQVGFWNEYGTQATAKRNFSVPARPFMGKSCDQHKGWQSQVNKGVGNILGGSEVIGQLNNIGEQMKTDIKDIFGQVSQFKRLKPSTIAKKGHNLPLMDSVALYDAIDYEVK